MVLSTANTVHVQNQFLKPYCFKIVLFSMYYLYNSYDTYKADIKSKLDIVSSFNKVHELGPIVQTYLTRQR